jgi:hypothetical protein
MVDRYFGYKQKNSKEKHWAAQPAALAHAAKCTHGPRQRKRARERHTHSQQEELQFSGTLISDSRTLLLLAAQAGTKSFGLQFPHQNMSLVHYVALSGAGHARSLAHSLAGVSTVLHQTLTCNSSNSLFIFGLQCFAIIVL